MQWVDIGVNLADKRFSDDLDQVLERARAAGVARQIITGTNLTSSHHALTIAQQYPDLYCTAGLHPHQASEFSPTLLSEIRQLAADKRVRAVGETGLDFNRDFSPRPMQERAFTEQLGLATELNLPAFLHQRDAHERFLGILKEHRDALTKVVVHCFTGNKNELFDYLDLDCHIGITGWICDPRRGLELQDIVANVPLNRLMVETDSPYLTPRNMEGKPPKSGRNEPALLTWVGQQVAQCYQLSVEEVATASWQTSLDFFAIE